MNAIKYSYQNRMKRPHSSAAMQLQLIEMVGVQDDGVSMRQTSIIVGHRHATISRLVKNYTE